jgi:hypothetical protein
MAERIYRQHVGREDVEAAETDSDDYYIAAQKIGYDPILDDAAKFRLFREQIEREFGDEVNSAVKANWAAVTEIASKLLTDGHVDKSDLDMVLRKRANL